MHSFALDRSRRFLHVVASGFWKRAEFDEYSSKFQQSLKDLRALGGVSRMLLDTRDYAVQSSELDEPFRQHLAAIAPLWPDRVAGIVTLTVLKMQADRITAGTRIQPRLFADERAAMAWLFESDEIATAA